MCFKKLKIWLHHTVGQSFLAVLLGCALTLAFAPFHLSWLGVLVPACLLCLWYFSTPKQAFWLGWLFGLGFFSTGVYWVYISIHTFGKAPAILAFIITVLFVASLALFLAIQGWLSRKLFKGNHLLWGFPLLWVLFEGFRTFILTGFPWLFLGYSQIDTVLSSIAPVLGVYGVSLVTLIFSSLLAALFLIRRRIVWVVCPLIALLLWVGLWKMQGFSWGVQPTGQSLTVSLVQGNIHQSLKWDERQLPHILETYRRLTNLHWSSDVVIWPEAAIPMLQENAQPFLEKLDNAAKQHHTAMILGIPVLYASNFYNGIITVGEGSGTYLKRHLVPFGEYVPLRSWLGFVLNHIEIPMSDMAPGNSEQGLLMIKGVPFSASICYEIAYPFLIASQLPVAQVLVTLTDDSWFDPSIAQDQQLQMTRMRALEVGRYLLAATNDGVTAIIDSKGHVEKTIQASQEGVVTGKVLAMKGSTPWVKLLNIMRSWLYSRNNAIDQVNG